ncbi:Na+/H+ antiporter subunit A [Ammoniphilus oxalaticus]|uniref:Na+/H+ antiporter subunit A n=1 Tax=Ammoniphilus oxalaticus TaxID=66863 RepID=A0A419SNZ7_9BACL|nr:Na+/H+ antiporter subunit A [Ammoniphilus oxalaticus]RKD25941.1 Na+/H+ antiporter subunit A [Ammoniphilus oxalaticus]
MSWLHLMILVPFISALFVPFIYNRFTPKLHIGWIMLLVPLSIFVYLFQFISDISNGFSYLETVPWLPAYDINFTTYIDGLSLVFGLLIAGIGSLVILYSIYYLSKEREALHNFYIYLLLFMGAMLGLVFSDNIYVLYVFWEITSISSFLLIAYWYERERSRYGAQKSMLITIFGGLAMLAGLIMLSLMADTNSIREMVNHASIIFEQSLFIPALILILLGAFTKSAQFPFSIWLPDAMEAPTPISAYLHSATMVKAGIYLVARLTPVFGGSAEWFWIVSSVGLITLLYGSVNAVRQTDLKALLAYSTISQLGLIMCLLGLGSVALFFGQASESAVYAVAIFAAIFHLVNHSTFKGCLFMVIGIIDHETGTRDIRHLGGLMGLMPVSFTLTIIGSFAMAGLPPFNGFLSKEMFFTAVLNASEMTEFKIGWFGAILPFLAWIASVFTFIYCMVLVFRTFRGKVRPGRLDKKVQEAPAGMLISPIILAAFVIIIFFIPNVFAHYLFIPASLGVLPSFAGTGNLDIRISAWHSWLTPELWMTIGVIVLGTLLYLTLRRWVRLYFLYPQVITFNNLYDFGIAITQDVSRWITNRYMTGFIRDYLVYIFTFLVIIVGGGFWLFNGFSFDSSQDAPITFYEVGIVLGMVATALTVLFSNSRLTSIIAVGGLGFLIAFFFVLFQAPDLALTQLVVETITTALFLLCFYHLPKLRKEISRVPFKIGNAIVALAGGAVFTLVALSANGHRVFDSISGYYKDSFPLAGAKNMVNAILVDFRGVDTMLEILVLTIAGMGVYTLIKLRLAGGDKNEGTE